MSPEGESDGEEVWDDDDDVLQEFSEKAPPLPEEDDASLHSSPHHTLVMWYTGFLLLLQARHYISDAAMNLILKFMNISVCFHAFRRFLLLLHPIFLRLLTS